MDNDYARDAQGNILRDSLGRPVKKRRSTSQPSQYFPPENNEQQAPRAPQTPSVPRGQQAQQSNARSLHYQSQPYPTSSRIPRPKKRKLRPLRILLTLSLLFLVIIPGAILVWADSSLNRIDALPATQIARTSGTNWLFVGSDSREGLTQEQEAQLSTGYVAGAGRTDTIMLLHVPTTGSATLISIPRDSYVNIPGYGMDKINAAFAYGGPQLLVSTVEQSTGIHIDHYAEIGFSGFSGLVDQLGGIELCPEEAINDPLAGLNINAGCQVMDGSTALGYVRTRASALGDLDRVVRQREFFSALVSKLTSASSLLNPVGVINSLSASFVVDEGAHVWDLLRIALAARSGLRTETVPVGGFQSTSVGSVVLWDSAEASALFNSLR